LAFRILDAIVNRYFKLIISLQVAFNHNGIIQVTIPVKPIFGVGNALRCTIMIPFGWMAVDVLEFANV
jgi:hypothetical protein